MIVLPESDAEKLTLPPVWPVTVTAVAAGPFRDDSEIVAVRVWPEPDGTEPKLRLTGSSATAACVALFTSSRPAPIRLTSVDTVEPLEFLMTPSSAVLTIADRTCAADHVGC